MICSRMELLTKSGTILESGRSRQFVGRGWGLAYTNKRDQIAEPTGQTVCETHLCVVELFIFFPPIIREV